MNFTKQIRARIDEQVQEFKFSKEQEQEMEYFVKVHCELHGRNCKTKYASIHADFKNNRKLDYTQEQEYSSMDYIDYFFNKYFSDRIEYGVFVGRCMPFHNGHNAIIQKIIRDGKKPIIILGGKGKKDERHPLSFEDRVKLIKKVYPMDGIIFIGLEDQNDWTSWYNSVKQGLIDNDITKEQITLYAHNKPEDNKDFEYRGKWYTNASYTEMFKDNGVKIQEIESITCELGNIIHGTDIRNTEIDAKRNLDARIYRTLKEKYDWWK